MRCMVKYFCDSSIDENFVEDTEDCLSRLLKILSERGEYCLI